MNKILGVFYIQRCIFLINDGYMQDCPLVTKNVKLFGRLDTAIIKINTLILGEGIKFKKVLAILITIMVLTACAKRVSNDYKFIGESEHWEAEYVNRGTEVWSKDNGNRTYFNEDSYQFELKYKGTLEELSSIRKLEYAHKTNSSGGETTREFDGPPGQLSFTASGTSKGHVKINEDEVIHVNVKWGDHEESFELHNKSK